jgi:hypothetical protein
VNLAESHALDNAGIVGSEKGVDLHSQCLGHVFQERVEAFLEAGGGFGGNNAKVKLRDAFK